MIPSEEYNSFFWIAMLQLLQLFVQLCNTIKAVHPFLQAARFGYGTRLIHVVSVGLESVMSQAL